MAGSGEHRDSEYGAAVYGSVLATALLGAMVEGDAAASKMTLSLLGSMLVFWLAHAWSAVVAERVAAGRLFELSRIREIARAEWPLVEAALVPAALLALGWAGWISRDTGGRLALAAAVLQLVGWGALAGHRTEERWLRALLVGVVDGLLGLAIVGLELALH
jgi:hypothetical protein